MVLSANGKSSINIIIGVPAPRCSYCGKELDFEFDYSCITCGRITCDNHNDGCREDDDDEYVEKGCDLVTCFVCFETHSKAHHSDSEGV